MISWASTWAMVLRHILVWKSDFNLLLMGFYWPLLDIIIWGFLGSWIQQSQVTAFRNYEMVALMGILLWQLVGRGSNFMIPNLAEELLSNNIVNLFSLPLRTAEWVLSIILSYLIMITIASIFCIAVIVGVYDLSLSSILSTFFIFAPPLIFSAIWIGFTCLQIIITFGKRYVEVAWVVGWFSLPFSGAYYPIEVLPAWAQKVCALLPMSYVLQGMRASLMHGQDPKPYLIKGYVLGIIYAFLAILIFVYCFNRSKQKGLARLAD
jgi:ABC-2 type transport system permease protein